LLTTPARKSKELTKSAQALPTERLHHTTPNPRLKLDNYTLKRYNFQNAQLQGCTVMRATVRLWQLCAILLLLAPSANALDASERQALIEELNALITNSAIQPTQYDRQDHRLYTPTTPRKDCDRYIRDDCDTADVFYGGMYFSPDANGALHKNLNKTENRPFRILDFPSTLKCSKFDFRTIHGCLKVSYFQPSARIYIDRGTDDDDEIDIFDNGTLNLSLDFVTIHLPWRFGRAEYYDVWSWGPFIGAGIGQPASDSEDGTKEASSAPVALISFGLLFQYKIEGASFGLEIGSITGFSADEDLADTTDSATFMGIKINIPTTD
jgi:hypothetical protein